MRVPLVGSTAQNRVGASDELLVLQSQLGQTAALDELIRKWHGPVRNYLRRMISDRELIDDVVQEVWVAVIRGLARLREPDRFVPWLFTITRRAVVNQLREELGGGEEVPIDEDIAFVSESHDRIEDAMLVSEAIDGLSLIEREVVILFYLEDLTVEEVAAIVNVPVGTAKSRLFRARRMLQQALNDKGVEHDG